MEKIEMYDPKREYIQNKNVIDISIHKVLNHGIFINGPEVLELEKNLSNFVGAKHCIAVSNGTDAITISLLALGISTNDEVITVSHSWISTVEVISLIKAKPVFIDIEDETFNMDYTKIEKAITVKTKAILVVSLYGQISDIDNINNIALKYNIPVIEDAAQSFGGSYNGKKSCNLTTIGTTSFFPSKPLGCYGDGGACFTNDDLLAIKMRAIKSHGAIKRFQHKFIGINGRLDTIQAAILNTKLNYFNETLKKRNECANYYTDKLKGIEKYGFKLPIVKEGRVSAWAQYSIISNTNEERDKIVEYLKINNINVSIFYPIPLHTQDCFSYLFLNEYPYLPITTKVCNTVFNLPCYAELTKEEQDIIINLVKNFFINYSLYKYHD
jgi:UDP-2-acetamido-2-deoxy-ribo-hexuluronate aminotransferase